MSSVEAKMHDKLSQAFNLEAIEIINESDKHSGHAGHDGSGESHFRIKLVSTAFAGMNRVARQRAVYDILSEELAGPVHALSVTAKTPDEAG